MSAQSDTDHTRMMLLWNTGRIENDDGVHVTIDEFTLCGDAFDAPDTEDDVSPYRKATSRIVTCERCTRLVLACRGVHVLKAPHSIAYRRK